MQPAVVREEDQQDYELAVALLAVSSSSECCSRYLQCRCARNVQFRVIVLAVCASEGTKSVEFDARPLPQLLVLDVHHRSLHKTSQKKKAAPTFFNS